LYYIKYKSLIGYLRYNCRLDFDSTRLDLGRLQRPNRDSFFPNLSIQHEFVYLLAVVKPRVPPEDVNICEVWSIPSTMSLRRRKVNESEVLHVWLDDLLVSSSVQLSYQML